MSQLLARIMLAIFMLPCAAVIYVATFVTIDANHLIRYPFQNLTWVCAGIASWAAIAIYWTLLWRASIQWTSERIYRTLFLSFGSVVTGILVGGGMITVHRDFGYWIGTVVAPLTWLILTTLVWRESASERAARATGHAALSCPMCGYNLTGLQSLRCPECGTNFTVDQLVSAAKHDAELDLR